MQSLETKTIIYPKTNNKFKGTTKFTTIGVTDCE